MTMVTADEDQETTETPRPNHELARYVGLRYEPKAFQASTLVEAASQVEGTDFP